MQTASLIFVPVWIVEVQTPQEDMERLLAVVTGIDPLAMTAAYDHNAFVDAAGTEVYRPRDGAVAGCEEEDRHRPGVVALRFEIGSDETLCAVAEAVFQAHGYQEPVIRAVRGLSARSRGLDDRDNPNRWWNREGDWKAQG